MPHVCLEDKIQFVILTVPLRSVQDGCFVPQVKVNVGMACYAFKVTANKRMHSSKSGTVWHVVSHMSKPVCHVMSPRSKSV